MPVETTLHRDTKEDIYTALLNHPACSKCEMERRLTRGRPDVSLYINSKPVAIEVQRSPLGVNDIKSRTHYYSQEGIYTLWVLPTKPDVEQMHDDRVEDYVPVYRPSKWEKFLHAMYFGRVYWHLGGMRVVPWHFGKFETWVPPSEWYDVEEGEWRDGGAYYKTSKIYKSVLWPGAYPGRHLDIVRDFRPTTRQAWKGGTMTIPESKIWIDKLPKWW